MASSPKLSDDVSGESVVRLSGEGKAQHFMGSCYSSKTKDGNDNSATNMPGPRPKSYAYQTKGQRYPGSATKDRSSASLEEITPMVNANLRRSKSSVSKLSSSSQSLDNKNANKETNIASTSAAGKTVPESKLKARFGFGMLRRKDDENSNKTSSQTSLNSQSSRHGGSVEKISKPEKGSKSSPLVECKNRNNLDNTKNDALSKSTKSPVIHRSSPAAAKRPVSAEYRVESKALRSDKSRDVQSAKSGAISSQSSSRLPVGGRGPLLSKLQVPKSKALSHTDHFAAKNISPYPSPKTTRNLSSKSLLKPAVSRPPSKVHNANVESTYNKADANKESEKAAPSVQENGEENGNYVCEEADKNSKSVVSSELTEEPGISSVKLYESQQDNASTTSSVRSLIAQAKRVSLTLNGSERFTPDSLPDTPYNKRAPLATFDSSVEGSSFSLLSDDLMLDYDELEDEELEKTLCKSLSAASTPAEEKSILQQFAMAQRKSPGDERSVLQQFALMNRKMKPRSKSVEALRKKSIGKSPLTIDSTGTVKNGHSDLNDSKQGGVEVGEVDLEVKAGEIEGEEASQDEEVCVSTGTVALESTPVIEEEVLATVHATVENRPTTLLLGLPKKVSEASKLKDIEAEKKAESKLSAPKTVKESKLQKKSGLVHPSSVKSGLVQPGIKSGITQSATKSVEKSEKTEKVSEKTEGVKVLLKTDKVIGKPPTAGASGGLTKKVYGEKKAPLVRSATDNPTRPRSQTLSELNQLMQDTTPTKAPHLRTRSQSSPLKPPRPRSVSSIDEEDYVQMDGYNYRHIMQDVTTFKTMLHKLKRQLQDGGGYRGSSFGSDTSAPGVGAVSISDAGSLKRQRYRDSTGSYGTSMSSVASVGVDELSEENTTLRHQVAVLQRQLEEKERTIKLLQQQMTKYTGIDLENPSCLSAATQTDEDVQDNKTNSKKLQKGTIPQKGQIPQKTLVNDILDEVTRRSNEGAENFRNQLNAVEDTFTNMTGNLRNAHRSFSQTSLNKVK
ncbi:uncharacterized protein LOC135494249 isoform X2 [Lineus longissimus]|uniref:uncharacterized protein LOC135494249 isoform X2 n=1 Tax=Lineus longissimus TaxID=88925 RepID=UPI00315DA604